MTDEHLAWAEPLPARYLASFLPELAFPGVVVSAAVRPCGCVVVAAAAVS
jgi:hypothetical protein